MILILLLIAQSADAAGENTAREIAFCSGPQSTQPLRFCLADQKHERAERDLTVTLAMARRAAVAQRLEIKRSTRAGIEPTFAGDPVRALEVSQRAWERSYRADCVVQGLSVATGNAGTEGVTTNRDCEADRIIDRVPFLRATFVMER